MGFSIICAFVPGREEAVNQVPENQIIA